GLECLEYPFDMPGETPQIPAAKGSRALRQTISGRGPDGPRSSDDHVPDGCCRGAVVRGCHHFEFMREEALLDEPHAVCRAVEGNRPIMPSLSVHGDVHTPRQ